MTRLRTETASISFYWSFRIKRYAVVLALAGLLIGADKKDDAKGDVKKIEGSWKMVSGQFGGQPRRTRRSRASR